MNIKLIVKNEFNRPAGMSKCIYKELLCNRYMKVIDQAALTLLDPTIDEWNVYAIRDNPTALNYIDLDSMSGVNWAWLMVYGYNLVLEELCTKHNGWDKISERSWRFILSSAKYAHLRKYKRSD